jgi:hypothetical protein
MTPRQAEIRAAYERLGSLTAAARELGLDRKTVRKSLEASARDPAMEAAKTAVGTGLQPALAWLKTKPGEDGLAYSVLLKPVKEAETDILDRIAEAFADIPAALPVAAPERCNTDLLTVYPIADAHVGLMAWGKETGEDYDTNIAATRIRDWIARAVDASPSSAEAVILDVGDMTHADDDTNMTPRSKHALSVDTRHFRTLDVTIAALAAAVDYALRKHDRVTVRILPGNHNQTSYMAVMFALAQRYRNEPRVAVQKIPGEFFVMQFGLCMLAAHHGHGAKADRIVHFIADQYCEVWGATRHRFLWTGHLHHHKSQDIGGVQWEQLRAVTARDAYAVSHAYAARAQLQAITYHRDLGEIMRVKVSE